MTNTSTEMVTIEKTVRIAAAPTTVWSFWTEPAHMAEWWGVATDVVLEPGRELRVAMEQGHVMLGANIAVDPPTRLEFTFGWENFGPEEPLAPGTTRVEVTLVPDGDGTIVTLRHFDMPTTHAADHSKGWDYYVLERLPAAFNA